MSDRQAYGELCTTAFELGEDECRVLVRIARRLEKGQWDYGALEVARDHRDFTKEAREEIEDALVYFACRWLRDESKKGGNP